ncbi:hypothetical protein HDV05_001404, partial [Chytridiales sp. JEL 0842]
MMHPITFTCITSIIASIITCINAHAVLINPPARQGMAVGTGIKYQGTLLPGSPFLPDSIGCEEFSAPAPPTATYTLGTALSVEWDITIPHPSPPGVALHIQTNPQSAFIPLAEGIDVDLKSYNLLIPDNILPAASAGQDVVLRWSWGSVQDGGYYVGCSDLRVVAGPSSSGSGSSASPMPSMT